MDVVLEHICDSAVLLDCHTVLNSEAWMAELAHFEAIVGIVAIDSRLSKPGHFLVSDATVNDVHLVSHVHLVSYNKQFEHSNFANSAYINLHFV